MNKVDLIERMIINSMSQFTDVPPSSIERVKNGLLKMMPGELIRSFNYSSKDCHLEYIGGNEYKVTVNPRKNHHLIKS
jgi:hypothetical protein